MQSRKQIRNPNFERFEKALFLKGEPDRVPFGEFWIDDSIKSAFIGREMKTIQDEIDFWYCAGYDYVKLTSPYDFNPAKRTPKEGLRTVIQKRNACTNTEKEYTWQPEGKGIITSMDEFNDHVWQEIDNFDFSSFDYAENHLPPGMKIIGAAGDIYTWVWELMGFETFCFAIRENEELVSNLFERIGSFIYQIFTRLVKYKQVKAFLYSDDIAYTGGLMISPKVYRKYLFPWMKKIGGLAKENNLIYIYHSDGCLWEVMEDLLDCGINGLQPIEPKAMNLKEIKERYGKRICLLGNVNLDRLARGTPEEVREMVKQCIEIGSPGGGYCIGSSSSIAEYVPLENYRALLQASFEFGNYKR